MFRYFIIISIFFTCLLTANISPAKETPKISHNTTVNTENILDKDFLKMVHIVETIVKGICFESKESVNSSFTIKPNKASLKIAF